MGKTSIEWCDFSFNPWIGCSKVSPACDHCYAESWAKRMGKPELWNGSRHRTAKSTWDRALLWQRKASGTGFRPRVFCASLADVFDNQVSNEWRDDLWALIRKTPDLDWLLLTKRPQNILDMLPADWSGGYPNVWMGTTVENQSEADRRISHLLMVPAVIRFLSCEPLLGKIDLRGLIGDVYRPGRGPGTYDALDGSWWPSVNDPILSSATAEYDLPRIHWVITGGESGKDFRDPDIGWYRDLRDQCTGSETPFFFKQHAGQTRKKIKAMGRELDGVIWDQFPETKGEQQ